MRKVEGRANFVVAKRQSHDQTVGATDRPSMGRNFGFFQWHRPPGFNASVNTNYVPSWMPFSGSCARAVSGETGLLTFPTGKPYTITAPAARFDRWKKADRFEHINAAINQLDRQQADREPLPSIVSIDTQSVKLAPMIGELRGLEANKKVNGRKRTFVVDTQGRLWVADVDVANRADGALGEALIVAILWRVGQRLEKIFGDQAYNGVFAKELDRWSIDFEKASQPESARGFVPVAKRWVVGRSIAWSNFFRRIVKDYEYTTVRRCGIFFGVLAVFS